MGKGLLVLIMIAALAAAGLLFYRARRSHELQATAMAAEQARLEEEKKRLDKQVKEQQAKIDALLGQLSSAKDEATRLALQKQLEEEREKLNRFRAGNRTKPIGPGPGAKPCNCAPGDPLCSCL
jgi:colicin import membrane protein